MKIIQSGKSRWIIIMMLTAICSSLFSFFDRLGPKNSYTPASQDSSGSLVVDFELNTTGGGQIKEKFTVDKNEFFEENGYNNDLAKCSFGLSVSAFSSGNLSQHWGESGSFGRENKLKKTFDTLGLTHQRFIGYDKSLNSSDSHAAFGVGKRTLIHDNKGHTLIVVAVRGGGYGAEWADNFNVGENGDYHNGFEKSASEVKKYLDSYIASNTDGDNVKLWLVGYSRGGAIANILASMYSKEKNHSVVSYTFATPNTTLISRKTAHKNIYNIINPDDIITSMPPTEWDFSREGTDVYLLTHGKESGCTYDDIKEKLFSVTGKNYNISDSRKSQAVFDILLSLSPTREKYAKNYQAVFVDLVTYGATKVKNNNWEKIGFREYIKKKYGDKALKAMNEVSDDSYVTTADKFNISLPDEFINFLTLSKIHNVKTNDTAISEMRVESMMSLFSSSFSDSFGNLHAPEIYLAMLLCKE